MRKTITTYLKTPFLGGFLRKCPPAWRNWSLRRWVVNWWTWHIPVSSHIRGPQKLLRNEAGHFLMRPFHLWETGSIHFIKWDISSNGSSKYSTENIWSHFEDVLPDVRIKILKNQICFFHVSHLLFGERLWREARGVGRSYNSGGRHREGQAGQDDVWDHVRNITRFLREL